MLREDQEGYGCWSASLLGEIEKQWPQGGMFNPKGGIPSHGTISEILHLDGVHVFTTPGLAIVPRGDFLMMLDPRAAWVLGVGVYGIRVVRRSLLPI